MHDNYMKNKKIGSGNKNREGEIIMIKSDYFTTLIDCNSA